MSDLSTPTVGLQVQSQKAEMRPGPQVDVSGAMRGQPDWQALGEAGSNLGKTVTNLFNDTAAKSAFLEYQKELGDIERNYINSNGNGSPEEIRKVQDLTNKAWSKFQQSTRNLAGANTYKIIEEANKYGVRFRDSILNNRAKFAEDYYQKNQAALVATNTEDYVFAADDPKGEAFASANAELERNLSELLIHNGFDKDDPLYTKTMADAKSAAILSNIKYHVANKDYTKGWRNYTHYVNEGILTGENRTSALSILQILKDQLASASGSGSSGKNNIAYREETGTLTPEDMAIIAAEKTALALQTYDADYAKRVEEYDLKVAAYRDALAKGGKLQDDGSVLLGKDRYTRPERMPQRETRDQIYNRIYQQVDMTNEARRKFYQAAGHMSGAISSGISTLRAQAQAAYDAGDENALANFREKILNASPAEIFVMSGATTWDYAGQVVADLQKTMGESRFSEFIDYLRFDTLRTEMDWAPNRIAAENMTIERYQAIAKEATERRLTIGEIIAQEYELPLIIGNEVGVKLLKYNSNPDNNYASTNEMKTINPFLDEYGEMFAEAAGIDDPGQAKAYAKSETVKGVIQQLAVRALRYVIDNNEDLVARRESQAKANNKTPEEYMGESYALVRINFSYMEQVHEKFEEYAKQYLAEQQAKLTGRMPFEMTPFQAFGQTYKVASAGASTQRPTIGSPNAVERFMGRVVAGGYNTLHQAQLTRIDSQGQHEAAVRQTVSDVASSVADLAKALDAATGKNLPGELKDNPFVGGPRANAALSRNLPLTLTDDPFANSQVTAQELAQGLDNAVGKQLPNELRYEPFGHVEQSLAKLERAVNAMGEVYGIYEDTANYSGALPSTLTVPVSHPESQVIQASTNSYWNTVNYGGMPPSTNNAGLTQREFEQIMALEDNAPNAMTAIGGSTYTPGIGFNQNNVDYDALWNRTLVLYNKMGDVIRYAMATQGMREADAEYKKMVEIRDSLSNIMSKMGEYQVLQHAYIQDHRNQVAEREHEQSIRDYEGFIQSDSSQKLYDSMHRLDKSFESAEESLRKTGIKVDE